MGKTPADIPVGILGGMSVKYLTPPWGRFDWNRLRCAHFKRKKVNGLALSMKQEKFCLEYAKSGNQRQAYLAAGYKCKNDASADASASQLLRNPKVKERLAELAEEIKNASIADITEMQQTLTKIIRQQMTEEVIVVESIGDFMSEARKMDKNPSIKDIINAINTLGKMQGAFTENVNLNGNVGVVIVDDIENS